MEFLGAISHGKKFIKIHTLQLRLASHFDSTSPHFFSFTCECFLLPPQFLCNLLSYIHNMPRTSPTAKDKAHGPKSSTEPKRLADADERVDLDNDPEEMEEEVEYEDVEEEEEEEVEEVEVEVEEVEVQEEEEVEEDDESERDDTGVDPQMGSDGRAMKASEEEKKKHYDLLALPHHGSEVYLGGIPHDASEEDLKGFCKTVGEVTEVRIMKGKDSGEGKGYAFVTFRTVEMASKAIEELNNSEFKGRKMKCSTSQAKHRLFIGNVPRNWGEEDIKKAVTEIGPGVISVDLLKEPKHPSRNRGYAFIEYYNHACAEYSRQKMSTSQFKLDDNAPTVSWADPKNVESSSASQVKAVYVKNLPKDITQNRLRELFEHHGKITKVAVPPAKTGQENRRYGFVHFAERSSATKALKNTEKYEIDGQVLECSLAKTQADQKSSGGANSQKSSSNPSYPPHLSYGLPGGPYGSQGTGSASAGFAPPLIYGRGATPAGLAMMPMLLPDGRIGYVMQQPGLQHLAPPPQPWGGRGGGRGSSSGGKRSSSSSHTGSSSRGRGRYNPY